MKRIVLVIVSFLVCINLFGQTVSYKPQVGVYEYITPRSNGTERIIVRHKNGYLTQNLTKSFPLYWLDDGVKINEDIHGLAISDNNNKFLALKYPIRLGDSWTQTFDDGGTLHTSRKVEYEIIGVEETVNTPAGTFQHITIMASEGWHYFFAPNIGLIRVDNDGEIMMTLAKFTKTYEKY